MRDGGSFIFTTCFQVRLGGGAAFPGVELGQQTIVGRVDIARVGVAMHECVDLHLRLVEDVVGGGAHTFLHLVSATRVQRYLWWSKKM